MRVADREQGAGHRDWIVHGGAFADAPIAHVAAEIAGRNRVDDIGLLRGDTHHAEVRPDRNAYVLEDAVVLLHGRMIDRHAGIVDGLVLDAERIGLRRPAEIVDRLRPVALSAGVDLVDRDDLARLRLGEQLLVVEAPPRGGIAAERLARIGRIGARARLHVHDADFEDVARLGAADEDRTGADVHPEAFTGAAAEQLAVDRSGAAAV